MMTTEKIYEGFLGDWELDIAASDFGQGEAPAAGGYKISDGKHGILFVIEWTDAEGKSHSYNFTGIPDGEPHPFDGQDLVDSMVVEVPTAQELTSRGFYKGRELMVAARFLMEEGAVMEITQTVLLPDGSKPSNVARYRRKLHS
ncbi:MAG: hypothetical protein HWE25_01595 [Alphaproteobacteria bacterium]|nr:hypothetical protein [Alphaproteobacteria bacterium]